MKYTTMDRYQLSRATLKGCTDAMLDTANSIGSITSILEGEYNGDIRLTPYQHSGLLTAMQRLVHSLEHHGEFALEQLDKEFEDAD